MSSRSGRGDPGGPGPSPALLEPLRHEGHQLDAGARTSLERSIGASFGDVVVHRGAASSASAQRAHAAAFTVGRHVVFGPGMYDPSSVRGRMLLAHELAHVVQQRRGGDLDAAESVPASALSSRAGGGHEHAAGVTAAQAALGMAAPVAGAAPVGVARQDKDEEEKWRHDLEEKALKAQRVAVKSQVGALEGHVNFVAGFFDAAIGASFALRDLETAAIDKGVELAGLPPEASELVQYMIDPNTPAINALRKKATELGFADKAGVPSLIAVSTSAFNQVDQAIDTHVFPGLDPKEDGYFTTRELSVLATIFVDEVISAIFGPEEIKLLVKVVGGLNVARSLHAAIMANPKGFYKDKDFWVAVAQAFLYLLSLRFTAPAQKLAALIVDVIGVGITVVNQAVQLAQDYARPEGRERDDLVKADIKALMMTIAGAIQQFLLHNRAPGKKGNKNAGQEESNASSQAGTPPAPGKKNSTGASDGAALPAKKAAPSVPPAGGDEMTPPSGAAAGSQPAKSNSNAPLEDALTPPAAPVKSPAKAPVTTAASPADTASAEVVPPPAKSAKPSGKNPNTVSNTKRRADAGNRNEAKAAGRVAKQRQALDASKQQAETAKARLTAAQAARAAEPSTPGPSKKLSPAEKEARAAKRAADSADKRAADADESLKNAEKLHAQAQAEAQKRNAEHELAQQKSAERKAAAALKAQELKPSEKVREEWEKNDRPQQQKALGANKGEQLHHAIELQVLDIPEFEGAVTPAELKGNSNIRVVPLEVGPEDAALLSIARSTPQSQWPDEVKAAVQMVPVKGGAAKDPAQPPDLVPMLKDRSSKGKPSQLHQSKVREVWDRAYETILENLRVAQGKGQLLPGTPERRAYVRKALLEFRDQIDNTLGSFWGQSKAEAGLRGGTP